MADIIEISNKLKAIADPTRLHIIHLLSCHANPVCVNAIAKKLSITQSAVSQHLRILRQADLVIPARQGYHIHYEINPEKFTYFFENLSKIVFPPEKIKKKNCRGECK